MAEMSNNYPEDAIECDTGGLGASVSSQAGLLRAIGNPLTLRQPCRTSSGDGVLSALGISPTSLSYPFHSIEGALNMHAHRFRNYRFFQLLVLTHTIHRSIHPLLSFRDKSP